MTSALIRLALESLARFTTGLRPARILTLAAGVTLASAGFAWAAQPGPASADPVLLWNDRGTGYDPFHQRRPDLPGPSACPA